MSLRLALAQWPIGMPPTFDAFAARVRAELDGAAGQGAAIAVLPEYLALELAAIFPDDVRGDFVRSLDALQAHYDDWLALFDDAARATGMHILAGTFLVRQDNGRYRNRAWLFAPDGRRVFQDKLSLTGFERGSGVVEAGDALKTVDTSFGRIGIAICYDSEFPLYARAQCEAGARLILVPSCTDTEAGATRVRVGCMARALENQVYVAQSVTAGDAPWSPALDVNTGAAALYAPSDRGLPPDGVVARAEPGPTWLIADIDPERLATVRQTGQVANAADWADQLRPNVKAAVVESLKRTD